MLGSQPARAAALSREVLSAAPIQVEALLTLGAALRRGGEPDRAIEVLTPLATKHPGAWGLQFELGVAWAALGDAGSAVVALTRATELNPQSSLAWHALGDQLVMLGDRVGAEAAQAHSTPGAMDDPRLVQGVQALFDGDRGLAQQLLGDRLGLQLTDLAAVRLLADVGTRLRRWEEVEALLAGALATAPAFHPARFNLAVVLYHQGRAEPALAEVERLLEAQSGAAVRTLRAALLLQLGDVEAAVGDYAAVLETDPDQPRVWLSYGHALKMVGRQADAVAAYRRSQVLAPSLGEAWWSLANLKTWRFEADDLAAMNGLLAGTEVGAEDRAPLHFALGKALEDVGEFEKSFDQYRQGNARRRATTPYDADANHGFVARMISTFTPGFLADRQGVGCPAPDPIFIVGLPRSGSTLVDQILSSHSKVESASELPDLTAIASGLAGRVGAPGRAYPEALGDLSPERFTALGEAYLARTQAHRRLGRARFIDKFPNNFMHAGLIHLILPRARIIDVRRRPLACCLSGFKQLYALGQAYSYDLADLGRYYADYVDLMGHFDAVLPGRIHQVSYEDLVEDPETEVRRLLDYCGLGFEAQCLRFYETRRAVRTASSEQVRRPIFRDGLDQWRRFEPWLGPLKAALGPLGHAGENRSADAT